MKLFALGGAGKICRETVEDAVQFGNFKKITIGDFNIKEAEKVAQNLDTANLDVIFADVYKKNVGIPMAIAAILIAQDKFSGIGALYPEYVFDPAEVFGELKKRNIFIHEDIEEL